MAIVAALVAALIRVALLPTGFDAVPKAKARREGVRQERHYGLRSAHPWRGGLRPAPGLVVHEGGVGSSHQEAAHDRLLRVATLAAQRRQAR